MALANVDAPLTVRLREITRSGIGEGRGACVLRARSHCTRSDFDVESFLSLILGYRADAQADPKQVVDQRITNPQVKRF